MCTRAAPASAHLSLFPEGLAHAIDICAGLRTSHVERILLDSTVDRHIPHTTIVGVLRVLLPLQLWPAGR
jgi:hypothetical protein